VSLGDKKNHFVQRLYSRFAFLALLALLAFSGISNLSVFNSLRGFDSRCLHLGFGGAPEEVNYVDFEVEYKGNDLFRITRIHRGGKIVRESKPTPIQRV
jgi:hypothetical protein